MAKAKKHNKKKLKQKKMRIAEAQKTLERDTVELEAPPKKKGHASAAYAKQANAQSHHHAEEVRQDKLRKAVDKRDYSYTQNRELSWLRFDDRVLTEALTPEVPLFERLKFCAIFQSNLDEWFMIRVGGLSTLAKLKRPPRDNKSNLTPQEQLDLIFTELPDMLGRQESAFGAIESQLMRFGLERVSRESFDDRDEVAVARYFEHHLQPIISPLIVDPRHPFPNLRNCQLYVMCALDAPQEGELLGMVEVPTSVPRVIELPSRGNRKRYTLVEDVIAKGLELAGSFGAYQVGAQATVRVTRNADIDPDGEGVEEEEDYRQHMRKILKRRIRLEPVRVEFQGQLGERLTEFVAEELGLSRERIFRMDMPLDLSYVYGLESLLPQRHRQALLFEPFEPRQSPLVDPAKPIKDQIFDHDVLLYYPYESMKPLLDLVSQAAQDSDCISIRITLYRVATRSRLCESLIQAAEAGKDVTVLMELRARFDEKNNIEWAERLSQAGCTVIYGSEGFKCHSKILQITYHGTDGLARITCLGTGNFNEKTARLYSDFMLMTADPGIGEDGNAFFRNLMLGNLRGTYKYLAVAPSGLKPLVMRGIDREISRARAGKPAKVFMKMNSLTDRDVIDKIAEATQAGVEMQLIVRGICCIKPDIPGKTEGLEIRQIVGRLLEHSRVYAFGASSDTVYLSSADMMTRNTERRVEIAYPVLDATCRALVLEYMELQLLDNVKARRLTASGTWAQIPVKPDSPLLDSQEVLIAIAYHRARLREGNVNKAPLSPELASLPPDVIRHLIQLYADHLPAANVAEAPAPELDQAPVVEDEVLAEFVEDGSVSLAAADKAVEANSAPASGVEAAPQAPVAADAEADEKNAGGAAGGDVAGADAASSNAPAQADTTDTQPAADHVDATLVDGKEPKPTALVTRKPNRVQAAFSLLGLAFRTLIEGPDAASHAHERALKKDQRASERAAKRAQKRGQKAAKKGTK